MVRQSMPRIIIVLGARRTGTTLVNQILCNEPRANPQVGECQLLARLCEDYQWSQRNYDRVVQWYFQSSKQCTEYFRSIVSQFIENAAASLDNPEFLVLKTPAFSGCKPELMELLPDARFVVCIRNPFDQVVSELDVGARQLERGMTGTAAVAARDRDVLQLVDRYVKTYQRLERTLGPRDLVVRFEDVVAKLETEIERLQSHTGMNLSAYDPDAEWKRFEHAEQISTMPAYVEQYGSALDSTRVGRFRDTLTNDEITSIAQAAGEILETHYADLDLTSPR